MGEFELIERFFKRNQPPVLANQARAAINSIAFGIGDDCALLQPAPGMQLAISTDMLVKKVAIFRRRRPRSAGPQGARRQPERFGRHGRRTARLHAGPRPTTRARARRPGSAPSREACSALADEHGCALIGGDTTAGPLNLCITVFGQLVGLVEALQRDGARAGDDVWVSGTLGDARLALGALRG